ncbi:MAG TPA: serine/threonine-protein kinase [Bryobacteraceae bacterium]|nr:serine/threonine-protein kinase [Bryobacteraceae bacterium]
MQADPETWSKLLALMDEWLELPAEHRADWLKQIESAQPDIFPTLQDLLHEPPDGFLETLPPVAADAPEQAWLAEGMLAGPYRLERELGRGGMGVVWLASRADGSLQREVALKFPLLYSLDPALANRFTRERDILAQLEDARIARLYDAGVTAQGQPYLALEYVEGEPITAYCDRLSLDVAARLKLFVEVLRAVQYAHANLVIHRDLKPANILVTRQGQVRLLDFGIARLLDSEETAPRDNTNTTRILTPDYASPEQIAGRAITTATDIYSLGILLYELLTGLRPRARDGEIQPSAAAIDPAQAQARGGVSARRLRWALRGDLDMIVTKATRREPRERYGTADAFAQDVGRHLGGQPLLARPASAWDRTRRFVRRNKLAVSAATAIVAAIATGGGIAWRQKLRADREAETAQAVTEFLEKDLLSQAASEAQAGPGKRPDPEIKVRTALDRAAARLPGKFYGQPAVEAAIRQTIGETYMELGLYIPAETQLTRALELRRRALGPDHPDTLKTTQTITDVLQRAGKYDAADALITTFLEAERRLGRENSREAMAAMVTQAELAAIGRADYPRAEALDRRVLDIERRVLGESDPLTLDTMNNFAAVLARVGKFPQAEEMYLRVIEAKRRGLGADHPSTLSTMNGLGVLYRNEGKYAEAEAMLKQALEGRRRVMGAEHRDTLASMNGLGLLYSIEGKFADAEPLLTAGAETSNRVLGSDNPDAQSCVNNLAELYRRENKSKLAESAYAHLLEARRRTYGADSPFTANTLGALGEVKIQLGKFVEAAPLLRAASDFYQKHRVNTWRRYYVDCLLGESLARSGRSAEGAALVASGYRKLLERKDSIPLENRGVLGQVAKWAPRP